MRLVVRSRPAADDIIAGGGGASCRRFGAIRWWSRIAPAPGHRRSDFVLCAQADCLHALANSSAHAANPCIDKESLRHDADFVNGVLGAGRTWLIAPESGLEARPIRAAAKAIRPAELASAASQRNHFNSRKLRAPPHACSRALQGTRKRRRTIAHGVRLLARSTPRCRT